MQKQAPSLGKLLALVAFTLSCFGLLLFLWLSFGGASPLKPKGYRVEVVFPEAATLAQEADVRISGVNVGKVRKLDFQERPPLTRATIEIESRFAPLPRDVRAILRQKTLLGETYVELTPGSRDAPRLDDGATLPVGNVSEAIELDEIFKTFDQPTREAFRRWVAALAETVEDGGGADLSEGLANLPGFAEAAGDALAVLDRRRDSLERLVRNTGVVFAALTRRDGQLRDLIVNSNDLFATTAARDEALAEIFRIFPTFLDESRLTVSRLEDFSRRTDPLIRDLRPVARDLAPTVRDLGDLAPDLEDLFGDLEALNRVAPRTLPDAERFIENLGPLFEHIHPWLQQFNPILAYANYHAAGLADFITTGGAALAMRLPPRSPGGPQRSFLRQIGIIGSRSLALNETRPPYERANAYIAPNAWNRMRPTGILESFDCAPSGGEQPDPREGGFPPCLVAPGSIWDGGRYPTVQRGEAPVLDRPQGNEGTEPAGP